MPELNLTLESPGVEIREFVMPNPVIPVGTTIYLVGFAAQGPTDEPTYVSTLTEYEEIFGQPETPAERYAYNAARQVLMTSNGHLLFTRMPYGSGCGIGYANTYSALVFPVVAVSASEVDACDFYPTLTQTEIISSYPWLYERFINSTICIGSDKFDCPQTHSAAATGLVLHNYMFDYDGELKTIEWVADTDITAESLTAFIFRPVVDSNDCRWTVVSSIDLQEFTVSDEGSELVIGSDGIATLTLTGVFVQDGDRIATYSELPVFQYYSASNGKSTRIGSSLPTVGSVVSAHGTSSTAINCLSSTNDFLIRFCYSPTVTGLDCATITALGLQVPEEHRWTFDPVVGDCQMRNANWYVLGEPIHKSLSDAEYELLKGRQFTWNCGCQANAQPMLDVVNDDVRAGLIIINEAKTTQLEDYSGYYVAVTDNLNINPSTDFDDITAIKGRFDETCLAIDGSWDQLPAERLNFEISAPFSGLGARSISEIIEANAGFDLGDRRYDDTLIVSLFKLRPTNFNEYILKLDSMLMEKFVGSMNSERMIEDSYGGPPRTMFIEEVVNRGSKHMSMMVNPYISENNCWMGSTGIPQKAVRIFKKKTGGVFDNFEPTDILTSYSDNMYGIGQYQGHCSNDNLELCLQKDVGYLPCKLERALYLAENPMIFDIDITMDAGNSTIWATRNAQAEDPCLIDTDICYHFDDTVFVDTNDLSPIDGNPISSDYQDGWEVIYNLYANFAKRANDVSYPGHLHIQDPVRQIFVNGPDFKVVKRQYKVLLDPVTGNISKRYSTFSRNIYTYLRNLYQSANSSYVCSYANWIRDYDKNKDKICWYPSSPYAAAAMARTDSNFFPWFAPMGTTRGVLPNVLDLAINPITKERDLIYRINLNPIVNFPGEGNLLWGQKTLLRTSSALDRINVRRLLLHLEKATQRTLWQFIGEPNTIITRSRVENTLAPIFENAKNNQGLYDYLIICDERNNTPDVIDQNALVVDIYLKPVKAIEFIKANFIVTRTGVDFGELI